MAEGGEVQGQYSDSLGSEDLHQLKCQPCLEDGNLHEAVGMCVDCQDYLCQACFDGHKLPKPCRNHQLLDREQMLQGQISMNPKDTCTEKCSVHEEKVIEYYCTSHCLLGCTVCITLDHKTCEGVQYIPHVAKDLANNEDYRKVEGQLKSALETFAKVSDNVKQNTESLETNCSKALDSIREYRRKVEAALSKIEAGLMEKLQTFKSKEMERLAAMSDKNQQRERELQSALAKIEALQNASQNCSSYIEMMRIKEKLKSLEAQIKEADIDKPYRQPEVQFVPNLETLDTLKLSETFGKLSTPCTAAIVSAKHVQDIYVKTGADTTTCCISGLIHLPGNKLMLTDRNNDTIKIASTQNGQILCHLKLSSKPWDLSTISKDKVAVTLPREKEVAIVTVGNDNLSVDRTLDVNGACVGVDYRNNKLAVSFTKPHQVQVLNLQGHVLHTISTDKQGKPLFNYPYHLTYGQDDTTLYVSNHHGHNVLCVKLDGTVVATYTDTDLKYPLEPVMDSSGNLLVCAYSSYNIHQISDDCQKVRVLLTKADGLNYPHSICFSEENDKIYVGMGKDDKVKVYNIERITQ